MNHFSRMVGLIHLWPNTQTVVRRKWTSFFFWQHEHQESEELKMWFFLLARINISRRRQICRSSFQALTLVTFAGPTLAARNFLFLSDWSEFPTSIHASKSKVIWGVVRVGFWNFFWKSVLVWDYVLICIIWRRSTVLRFFPFQVTP